MIHFGKKQNASAKKQAQSNLLSTWLRPVFEHQQAKNILGFPLLVLTVLSGALNAPLLTAMGFIPANLDAAYQPYESLGNDIVTKPAVVYPVAEAIGISQGYHVFHPAIDIRAPLGSEIRPVAAGVITLVEREKYGYGNYVEVDHENGYTSLYAHMDTIGVESGQKVTTETVLGTVGLTGHTTGPHLHLEVRYNGRYINPLVYLAR
jgi:murein DD-endopeptidase MepM/ murein hydrolase activator NlpD